MLDKVCLLRDATERSTRMSHTGCMDEGALFLNLRGSIKSNIKRSTEHARREVKALCYLFNDTAGNFHPDALSPARGDFTPCVNSPTTTKTCRIRYVREVCLALSTRGLDRSMVMCEKTSCGGNLQPRTSEWNDWHRGLHAHPLHLTHYYFGNAPRQ